MLPKNQHIAVPPLHSYDVFLHIRYFALIIPEYVPCLIRCILIFGRLTKQTSLWVANSWVQGTALAVCLGAWLIKERQSFGTLFQVDSKYMLLGGVIGAFITLTVILSMDQLGPAKAALIIVVSQLAVAYLIELFGLFGMEKVDFQWSKLLGMIVAVVGIFIFKWQS